MPADVASRSRLLIAGEIWEDREAVTQAITNSPYRDRITLVDTYIPDESIPLYFNAADVVSLPYLRASQSGVAHIAMAFGKPIVVSKVGGLEESMADYAGTFFVPPGDVGAIRDALLRLYAEKPGPTSLRSSGGTRSGKSTRLSSPRSGRLCYRMIKFK